MAAHIQTPLTALFLEATAHDSWLSVADCVSHLEQAGYWARLGELDAAGRADHVLGMLRSLRDPSGQLLFESVEALAGAAVTTYYKQWRLISRGRWNRSP
jgi:hypothetical protein